MENISNHIKKGSNKRFVARVFVAGIVFSIATIFILRDISKEYEATVLILVVPKSQIIATQSETVMRNIAEFPKTLAFYERLLKFNPEIKDGFAGMEPTARKNSWNGTIKVSENGSGIITLTVFAKNPTQAEALSKKTAQNLFQTVSNFYDIKTDIGISIIDGPLVSSVWRNRLVAILFSIAIGLSISLVLNIFLDWLEKKPKSERNYFQKSPLRGLKNKIGISTEEKKFAPKEEDFFQDVPYYFEEMSDKKILEFEDEYPDFSEAPNPVTKSASAPANLPIAETDFIFGEENKTQEEDHDFIEMKKQEPTVDEMKERLNKLLKGEI